MSNVNDTYFDGYYKDIWKAIIPQELTAKELDFMLQYFNLEPGCKVLDIMCGHGRHAVGLAEKGMVVTAVDNLGDYIGEIKDIAAERNLALTAIKENIISYKPADKFDLVICMGNSLNFFDAGDTQKILNNVSAALRPGGHLLINSWSVAEIAIPDFKEKTWSRLGDLKFIADSKYLFQPTRIETEHWIIAPDGKTETKTAIDYIYSINEMESIIENAGLTMKEIYSIPGRKKFKVGDPRIYIVATKS